MNIRFYDALYFYTGCISRAFRWSTSLAPQADFLFPRERTWVGGYTGLPGETRESGHEATGQPPGTNLLVNWVKQKVLGKRLPVTQVKGAGQEATGYPGERCWARGYRLPG